MPQPDEALRWSPRPSRSSARRCSPCSPQRCGCAWLRAAARFPWPPRWPALC